MKNFTMILLSLIAVGCTSLSTEIQSKQKTVSPAIEHTNIFYHYVNPVHHAQAMALVRGTFKWSEGCLYLVDNNGKRMTPLFPELPKGIVKWDEATKTISLDGHIFRMGDRIVTNGGYLPYHPKSVGGAEYEKQGDKKCLTPTMVMVGTSIGE